MANRRHHILLVEDEVGIRDAFAMLLEMEGFAVQTAVDGVDAIDQLARAPIDLVLTDYMMPRMDGMELARHIRARPNNTAPLPIVMVTAACGAGVFGGDLDAVLVKPVDATTLLQTIRALLPLG